MKIEIWQLSEWCLLPAGNINGAKIDRWKLIKEQEYLTSKCQSILKEMVTLRGRKLTDTNIVSDQDKHCQMGKGSQGAL